MDEPTPTPAILMPLCSVFRRFLRSRGLKYTTERADVLQSIIDHDGPFEAEELLLAMRQRGHHVSKATIYRTLRLLQEAGIITQALFDSKQSHFQLIYGKQPQDVMVCLRTGRAIDFQSPELVEVRDRICAELGWKAVGHRFQIFAMSPEEADDDEESTDAEESAVVSD
jgi:Fur family ferric uptake transcriptional regulator